MRTMMRDALKDLSKEESREETLWEIIKSITEIPHKHHFHREEFEIKFNLERGKWHILKVKTKKREYTPDEFKRTVKESLSKVKELTIKLSELDKRIACDVCGMKVKYGHLAKH